MRKNKHVIYNTALPVIFGVKKYADALWKVCKKRDIEVNTQMALVEIRTDQKEAVFENLKNPGEKIVKKVKIININSIEIDFDVLFVFSLLCYMLLRQWAHRKS